MDLKLLNEALQNLSNIPAKFKKVETIHAQDEYEGEKEVYQLTDKLYLVVTNYTDSYDSTYVSGVQICERTEPRGYIYQPI